MHISPDVGLFYFKFGIGTPFFGTLDGFTLIRASDRGTVAHQTELEENNGVDAPLAALPIVAKGKRIQEVQIDLLPFYTIKVRY